MTAALNEETRETVRDMVIRLSQVYEGPHDITDAIVKELDPTSETLRGALAEILPSYCTNVLGNQRRQNGRPPLTPVGKLNVRSAKGNAIHDWYRRFLDESQVPTEGHGWRRLGDCTASELLFCATTRKTQASKLVMQASGFEALAAAMNKRKVKVLRDMPESVVRSVIGSVR